MSWNNGNSPWGQPNNNQGGNRKGSDPWQSKRPSNGSPQPNGDDIEEMLNNLLRRMGGWFGGGRAPTPIILMGVLAVVAVWLLSGIYQVSATQLGVVLRFGEPNRVETPGLRYHLPSPIETVLLPEVTLARRTEIGFSSNSRQGDEQEVPQESMMLTGDENIIDVNFEVVWQVDPEKVKDFLFNIRDPSLTVKAAAESVMREVIGQTNIQSALTDGRSAIESKTHDLLQKLLAQYQIGVLVTQVNLRAARPPAEVADAFQDVTRARSDKETTINQAETYRSSILPEAQGQAARMLQEAQAYKTQVVNVATGNAERFLSVYQSYQASKETAARQMYLEAMEEILKDANKVVLDGSGARNLTPYLPVQDLLKPAGGKN